MTVKKNKIISCIKVYQTGVLRILMTVFVAASLGSNAVAGEVHQTTAQPSSQVKWFPPPDVLTNVYQETLPQADALRNAYQLALQGENAQEAIADIQKAIKMCEDYISANPNDKEGTAQAYGIIA